MASQDSPAEADAADIVLGRVPGDILGDLHRRRRTSKRMLWPDGTPRHDLIVFQKRRYPETVRWCYHCSTPNVCCREHQFQLTEHGIAVYVTGVQLMGYEGYEG